MRIPGDGTVRPVQSTSVWNAFYAFWIQFGVSPDASGWMPCVCAYHTDYDLPLPAGHPFPMAKYPLLFERLLRDGVIAP